MSCSKVVVYHAMQSYIPEGCHPNTAMGTSNLVYCKKFHYYIVAVK
jgi:hypothetical protein